MSEDLTLVRVGMNMDEATIVKWYRGAGDLFAKGDPLYEIETDKVTYVVEAPHAGRLLEILVAEGEDAMVGETVGRFQRTAGRG
jgi:pyruvate/2-oxoglutarate dehydrogenase complex dihydrolipoamide acyltransferase (E2) component